MARWERRSYLHFIYALHYSVLAWYCIGDCSDNRGRIDGRAGQDGVITIR